MADLLLIIASYVLLLSKVPDNNKSLKWNELDFQADGESSILFSIKI